MLAYIKVIRNMHLCVDMDLVFTVSLLIIEVSVYPNTFPTRSEPPPLWYATSVPPSDLIVAPLSAPCFGSDGG